MRTVAAIDTALLTSETSTFKTWIKVEMTRDSDPGWGSETWVDLTELNGYDWVKGVSYGEQIDQPAWTASVRLLRQQTDNPLFTLSPFIAASVNNAGGVLIQPYRKIRISTAIVPLDTPRDNATFNIVFVGRVDSFAMNHTEITLQCRDRSAELMDFFIQEESPFGADDPASATAEDLEEIIQNIIDDHYNGNSFISGTKSAPRTNPLSTRTTDGDPFQLYSANGVSGTPFNTSTGAAVRLYNQTKQTVWQAIERLAKTNGYQIRMRYHEGSGINDFVLVYEEPDRTPSGTDLTLDPTTGIVGIAGVSLGNNEVRNSVRVGYTSGGGGKEVSETTDTTSRDKYGLRWMEIQEGSTSQIDTSTEADAMRDAILTDLKEPLAVVTLECPYLWFVQLNDYIELKADGFFFDSDQDLAVISRRNMLEQGGRAKTQLILRGAPTSGRFQHVSQTRTFGQPGKGTSLLSLGASTGGYLPNGGPVARPGG